jgi:hypothetical protein
MTLRERDEPMDARQFLQELQGKRLTMSVGHRSAFIGAVLKEVPGAVVAYGSVRLQDR